MVIAFTNNETGFTAVKDYSSDAKKLKEYQNFHDRLFGKGKFTFFFDDGFFKPFHKRIPNQIIKQRIAESNVSSCMDMYERGF